MLRLWLAIGVGVVLLATSGLIASMARAQPGVDPVAVISAYENARNSQDIEAALTYFADNAIVSQRNTTYAGKNEIRKYLDMVSSRSRFVVVSDRHSTGNIVTWTERTSAQFGNAGGRPQGYAAGASTGAAPNLPGRGSAAGPSGIIASQPGFAITVEAVVQDGKIQSLAYVFGGPSPRADPSLEGRAELPAGLGLAAVVSVLAGILLIASIGLGRATPVASSLQGRLLQDLQGWAAARE
jgi:ketosteroid isomerase-like protein